MLKRLTILTILRASNMSAMLVLLVAGLLLAENVTPFFDSLTSNPLELMEAQEESESKTESEQEKELEVEDADEFLHRMLSHRFGTLLQLNLRIGHLIKQSLRYSVSDTPPPERG
jgi:hypothetical protein